MKFEYCEARRRLLILEEFAKQRPERTSKMKRKRRFEPRLLRLLVVVGGRNIFLFTRYRSKERLAFSCYKFNIEQFHFEWSRFQRFVYIWLMSGKRVHWKELKEESLRKRKRLCAGYPMSLL